MADTTVTGLTAARMKEIEAASIVDARINDLGELILTTNGGQDINVGSIKGPKGDQGPQGAISKVAGKGDDGTGNIPLTAADLGAASKSDIASAVPPGVVLFTARSAATTGWLLCQGQAVSRTTYSALYAAIGTTYGAGDGSTTFLLPDLRNRVPVGKGTASYFDTLGEKGGEYTHTLTDDEMPSHNHRLTSNSLTATKSRYSGDVKDNGGNSIAQGDDTGRFSAKIQVDGYTSTVGGDGAHNNLQPYIVLNAIIKT